MKNLVIFVLVFTAVDGVPSEDGLVVFICFVNMIARKK